MANHDTVIVSHIKQEDEITSVSSSHSMINDVPPPYSPELASTNQSHKVLRTNDVTQSTDDNSLNHPWVLCGAVSKEMLLEIQPELDTDDLQPVGSWTNFMKSVTDSTTTRCKLEYLPVIPLPPHDNVVKWYMDMILKMLDQLEIDHIFLHADEAIDSKVLIIQWLNQGKYDQIITFLGGFHTIMVNLKILGKKYSCLGFKEWWVDADVIAQGSADQAIEGKHYHRSVRLHKQAFEALLRYRMKGILTKDELSQEFKRQIVNLRLAPKHQSYRFLGDSMVNDQVETVGSSTSASPTASVTPDTPQYLCTSTTSFIGDSYSNGRADNCEGAKESLDDITKRMCLVCGDVASGYHYGVASCEACKAFFKRTIQGNIEYVCPSNKNCEITKRRRKACQACRFEKCLTVGMLKEGVRLDRVRGGRQKYRRASDPYPAQTNKVSPIIVKPQCHQENLMLGPLLQFTREPIMVEPDKSLSEDIRLKKALTEVIDKELTSIIGWAKHIPGFTKLSLNDQMRLLQSTWAEILNIVAQRLERLKLSQEEFIMVKAIILLNSDIPVDNADEVSKLSDDITKAFVECIKVARSSTDNSEVILMAEVLRCLPLLRQLSDQTRKYWSEVRDAGKIPLNKLFIEMLDSVLK
ncbi:Estrogen-related receptor gamma [Nymphon striatum]|nr:Estrogen-related receptor gamma [Nymphon striatum]